MAGRPKAAKARDCGYVSEGSGMSLPTPASHPNHDVTHIKATYIALYELNFDWRDDELDMFDRMWRKGLSVKEIAEVFMRDPDEVTCLAMDRARKRKIQPRQGGALGRSVRCQGVRN